MRADQIIAFANSVRAKAPTDKRDINAQNLFVHNLLMQALEREAQADGAARQVKPASH